MLHVCRRPSVVVDAWQVVCQSVRIVTAHRSLSHTTATTSMKQLFFFFVQASSRQAVCKTDATLKAVKISLVLNDPRMDKDRLLMSAISEHIVLPCLFRGATIAVADRDAS